MRPAQRTRPGTWHSSASAVSTTITTTGTDDPLAHSAIVPRPTLHIVFGGPDDGDLALAHTVFSSKPSAPPRRNAAIGDAAGAPHPNRIELSIDSLPNLMLVEPI